MAADHEYTLSSSQLLSLVTSINADSDQRSPGEGAFNKQEAQIKYQTCSN